IPSPLRPDAFDDHVHEPSDVGCVHLDEYLLRISLIAGDATLFGQGSDSVASSDVQGPRA
ncbi:MAG: hypothetical protein LN414_06960, partial [Candidatus Thermoplasmatota archaeon]|nr:hypothetical protein [Candidatus Thermoplasmatota archaeon]